MLYRVEITTEVYVEASSIEEAEEVAKQDITDSEVKEFAQYYCYTTNIAYMPEEWKDSYPFSKKPFTKLSKTCRQILEGK